MNIALENQFIPHFVGKIQLCQPIKQMNYELWHSKTEGSYLFISRNDDYEKNLAVCKNFSPDLELAWTYKAKTHFEAMQAYYNYMNFGQYKPETEWEDIIYDRFD